MLQESVRLCRNGDRSHDRFDPDVDRPTRAVRNSTGVVTESSGICDAAGPFSRIQTRPDSTTDDDFDEMSIIRHCEAPQGAGRVQLDQNNGPERRRATPGHSCRGSSVI